jgi:hypothetical protein
MGTKLQMVRDAITLLALFVFIAVAFVPVSTYRWLRYGSRFDA